MPNYCIEKSPQPTSAWVFGEEDVTVNIVTGIIRLKFSGARTSSAKALTRESGASGSLPCAVDFLDLDFLSMVVQNANGKFQRISNFVK